MPHQRLYLSRFSERKPLIFLGFLTVWLCLIRSESPQFNRLSHYLLVVLNASRVPSLLWHSFELPIHQWRQPQRAPGACAERQGSVAADVRISATAG